MLMAKLLQEQIALNLSKIPGWSSEGSHYIERTITFADFRQALAFVNQVGEFAEAANHHPDIDIRYNKITIRLSTHEENGLTGKDFALAQKLNSITLPQ
jgi:4a-hydroxytetrahydrobiopterin dehydratase